MRKIVLGFFGIALLLSSCVSQKKYADLEAKAKETQDLLNSATVKLNTCLEEKATATSRMKTLEDQNAFLKGQQPGFDQQYGQPHHPYYQRVPRTLRNHWKAFKKRT